MLDKGSIKLLAEYCSAAYKQAIGEVENTVNNISPNFKLNSVSDNLEFTHNLFYRSLTVANHSTKTALIVHSGTRIGHIKDKLKHFVIDVISDLEVIAKEIPTQFIEDGEEYLNQALIQLPNYKFITVGLSLGGVFAQLSHIYLASKGADVKSYAIDPIGSFEVLRKYTVDKPVNITDIFEHSSVYNLEPNLINSANKQFGHRYKIQFHNDNLLHKILDYFDSSNSLKNTFSFIKSTVHDHSLTNLQEQLEEGFEIIQDTSIEMDLVNALFQSNCETV